MKIRICTADDIHIIRNIAYKTWPISYADMISKEQIDYMLEMMYNEKKLNDQMTDGHSFYIIESGGIPVGFAGVEPNQTEKFLFIHKLYVLPSFQGKGIGKELINNMIEKAAELKLNEVRLHVNRTNKAVQFYVRNGFEIMKTLDTDIGGGFFMNDYAMKYVI